MAYKEPSTHQTVEDQNTAILLPALVAQAQQNNTWRFKLWATTIKGENPHMSGFVDIDTEGVVGFNRTGEKYFPGFVTHMHSGKQDTFPTGQIVKEDGNLVGALVPTTTGGLYNLRFADVSVTASTPGRLMQDFSLTDFNCGMGCGGVQLVYDLHSPQRKWVAYPDQEVVNGWKILYWNGAGEPPNGGIKMWLWRDASGI
ncbi:hypothetical protein FPQ18DRAFT_313130 [Pyronema domesticum]|nr:hypothetical protein FPQ18DRAFT_313130 [Pyronema domesticum]